MFKNFMKEFKSLSKQFNKLGLLTKVVILVVLICVLYTCVYKPRILGYSFSNSLTVTEGFVPSGQSITFYKMSTCPHCKEFEFGSKTATSGDGDWRKFVEANSDVPTRVVESSDPECEQNGITGYPTVLITDANNAKVSEIPRGDFPNDVEKHF
jgi:hypothetical protein